QLVVIPTQLFADARVRRQAVAALVQLRGAHDGELLQFEGQSAGVQDSLKMRDHCLKNLWPVGDGAKHVGHVSALLHVAVVDFASLGSDLIAIQPRNFRGNGLHSSSPASMIAIEVEENHGYGGKPLRRAEMLSDRFDDGPAICYLTT